MTNSKLKEGRKEERNEKYYQREDGKSNNLKISFQVSKNYRGSTLKSFKGSKNKANGAEK
jgi:hypothetical protein